MLPPPPLWQLLGELLLDRHNFTVMTRYISKPENLKLMMNLLRDKSPNIQFEAFHVFKVKAHKEALYFIACIYIYPFWLFLIFVLNFQRGEMVCCGVFPRSDETGIYLRESLHGELGVSVSLRCSSPTPTRHSPSWTSSWRTRPS